MHTLEYYSVIKKKEILPFAIWVKFEDVVINEISEAEKDKYCLILHVESKKWKLDYVSSVPTLLIP